MIIDSIEDYKKIDLSDINIKSKKHGEIAVPCLKTVLINKELIKPNNYNPNTVSKQKMQTLEQSILLSGFCFPVVVYFDEDFELFIISDGEHRDMMMENWMKCDYVPCVVRPYDESQRMIATIQFNKAKGSHRVDLDAEVVRNLLQQGLSEEEISLQLGIDEDRIHRYKELTGILSLFNKVDYSMSYEMQDENQIND